MPSDYQRGRAGMKVEVMNYIDGCMRTLIAQADQAPPQTHARISELKLMREWLENQP